MAVGSDTHTRRCIHLLAIVGLASEASNKLLLSSLRGSFPSSPNSHTNRSRKSGLHPANDPCMRWAIGVAFAEVDASHLYRHGMPWLLMSTLLCLETKRTGWRHYVGFKTGSFLGFVTQTFSRPSSTTQLLIALAKSVTTPGDRLMCLWSWTCWGAIGLPNSWTPFLPKRCPDP